MRRMPQTLTITEIFRSLQGEGTRTGLPCAFVRLTGCNLRCRWCDTAYAWEGGTEMHLDAVIQRVDALRTPRVLVTGGEPLLQPHCPELLSHLCDEGYETLLETNGSTDISAVDPRVVIIMDLKCPSSGESDANLWSNVNEIGERDEIKFVIADHTDFDWACERVREYHLGDRCPVTVSPVHGQLAPAELAGWILGSGLDLRLGLQLHKILWPDRDRGV